MAIELLVNCDECRTRLDENDEVYCIDCYSKLDNEVDDLEEKITQLEEEIEALNEELETLHDRINK